MLSPIYSVVFELYIYIGKNSYACKYSVRYGEWEVVENPNPREILSLVERKVTDGYKIKSMENYKILLNATRKVYT